MEVDSLSTRVRAQQLRAREEERKEQAIMTKGETARNLSGDPCLLNTPVPQLTGNEILVQVLNTSQRHSKRRSSTDSMTVSVDPSERAQEGPRTPEHSPTRSILGGLNSPFTPLSKLPGFKEILQRTSCHAAEEENIKPKQEALLEEAKLTKIKQIPMTKTGNEINEPQKRTSVNAVDGQEGNDGPAPAKRAASEDGSTACQHQTQDGGRAAGMDPAGNREENRHDAEEVSIDAITLPEDIKRSNEEDEKTKERNAERVALADAWLHAGTAFWDSMFGACLLLIAWQARKLATGVLIGMFGWGFLMLSVLHMCQQVKAGVEVFLTQTVANGWQGAEHFCALMVQHKKKLWFLMSPPDSDNPDGRRYQLQGRRLGKILTVACAAVLWLGTTLIMDDWLVPGLLAIWLQHAIKNLLRDLAPYLVLCRQSKMKGLTKKRLLYGFLYNVEFAKMKDFFRETRPKFKVKRRTEKVGRAKSIRLIDTDVLSGEVAEDYNVFVAQFSKEDLCSKRIFLPIKVRGCGSSSCLVDTGAVTSTVSEALVKRWEAERGEQFPRGETDIKISGVGDSSLRTKGVIYPDLEIRDEDGKRLILKAVPHYVIEQGSSTDHIIGANLLDRLSFAITSKGPVAHIKFQAAKGFGTVIANLKDRNELDFEFKGEVREILPKSVANVTLSAREVRGKTSWDKQALLTEVEKTLEVADIHIQDTIELKAGQAKVQLHNAGQESLFLFPGRKILSASPLLQSNPLEVGAILNDLQLRETQDFSVIDDCVCQIKEKASLAVMCDSAGFSYTSETVRSQFDDNPRTEVSGFLQNRHEKVSFFIPHKKSGFRDLANIEAAFAFHRRHPALNNHLVITYAHQSLLTSHFRKFVSYLRKWRSVTVAELSPTTDCQKCSTRALERLKTHKESAKIKEVEVVIPGSHRLNGDHQQLQKVSGTNQEEFIIFNEYHISTFLSSPSRRTFLVHFVRTRIQDKAAAQQVITEIGSRLKLMYPNATLTVQTSAGDGQLEPPFLDKVREGVKALKWALSLGVPTWESKGRRPKSDKSQ